MFKKGLDYYFGLAYILFLFLHFLFFLPYVFISLLINLEFDFDKYIDSEILEDIFGFYISLFLRNDLDVYFTIVSIWFLYIISNRFVKSQKKDS